MVWLSVFAKICCRNACHPVTAISVVPKLVTTQAVWMPGLDVPRCGLGVGRSAKAETYPPSAPPRNEFRSIRRWRSGHLTSAERWGENVET
jgi:hypothetical protein